ncbi:alpha/beta hydrolase family protein [Salinibacter altiplanensis]|uniref:alpha/beta hydrolase family protein n=1 Tax=Salinibacter altiplanensis TaxID=1803181 RepID=UPI001F398434|nr:CocE/NonD family hydrolase [Salinibacter altiplanensis]
MSNGQRIAVLLVVGLRLLGPTTASAQEAVVGVWSGTLKVKGMEVRLVFHVEQGEEGLTATMDSPDQGATGIPVSNVSVAGDSVTLAVDRILATYEGALVEGGTRIKGQWVQGGQSFPLTLSPADKRDTAPPPRPQHPEPPYPYVADSVTVRNDAAGITLAGTLTRPEDGGPHPAVVLVSGSGPQDRNSEVANHKLFHVFADHLTRQGIAVLRYDERGVGASEGTFDGATSKDFAGDVAAAVRFLKNRSDIDSGAVGLIGMSEGGPRGADGAHPVRAGRLSGAYGGTERAGARDSRRAGRPDCRRAGRFGLDDRFRAGPSETPLAGRPHGARLGRDC